MSTLEESGRRILNFVSAKQYYAALGIPPGRTDNEIRAAFLSLVHVYHPDRNHGSAWATEVTKALMTAQDELLHHEISSQPCSAQPQRNSRPQAGPPVVVPRRNFWGL